MTVRRLLKVMAGLGIGAIGLVAWAGTSSAETAPPPPGPVANLLGQALPPVEQIVQPLAPGLLPVVDGVVNPAVGIVDPTLAGLGPTVNPVVDHVVPPVLGLLDPVLSPVPGVPVIPGPGQPQIPALPGPGQAQIPALPLPGPGTSPLHPVGADPVITTDGAENAASAPTGQRSAADAFASSGPSSDDGSSSSPISPLDLPAALLGAGGSILSSATGSGVFELALVAVMSGAAALAAAAVWRRLAHAGLLTPRAMSYAIATPPG